MSKKNYNRQQLQLESDRLDDQINTLIKQQLNGDFSAETARCIGILQNKAEVLRNRAAGLFYRIDADVEFQIIMR